MTHESTAQLLEAFRLFRSGVRFDDAVRRAFGTRSRADGNLAMVEAVEALLTCLQREGRPMNEEIIVSAFELGRVLYEARVREAWDFDRTGAYAERRLAQHPYPRHPADANPVSQNCAEIELAQAQARQLLRTYVVTPRVEGDR